jgi:hypothetical protein
MMQKGNALIMKEATNRTDYDPRSAALHLPEQCRVMTPPPRFSID